VLRLDGLPLEELELKEPALDELEGMLLVLESLEGELLKLGALTLEVLEELLLGLLELDTLRLGSLPLELLKLLELLELFELLELLDEVLQQQGIPAIASSLLKYSVETLVGCISPGSQNADLGRFDAIDRHCQRLVGPQRFPKDLPTTRLARCMHPID
jgi:hypothetical protein